MKRKPWILIVLAILHFIAPFGTMALNAHWAGRDFFYHLELFFQPFNFIHEWPHLILPWVAAAAIWSCRKWSFYLYIICILGLCFVSFNNYYQGNTAINPTRLSALYIFNLVVVAYFLLPAVRKVYFDPRMRWWETSPRYFINVDSQFFTSTVQGTGFIENISESGLLIKSENLPADKELISVDFKFDETGLSLKGRVIHHQHLNNMGFGIKFIHDLSTKRKLKSLIQVLNKKGLLDPKRMPGQEDRFTAWISDLLHGKGIIPTDKKS
jgi:hypothetical protein